MTIRKLWKTPLKKATGFIVIGIWFLKKKENFEAKVLDVQTIPFSDLKIMMNLPEKKDLKALWKWLRISKKCMLAKLKILNYFKSFTLKN